MPEKEHISARIPKDEAAHIEDYADQADISQSDAVRRFIRWGIDAQQDTSAAQLQRIENSVEHIEHEVTKPFWRRLL